MKKNESDKSTPVCIVNNVHGLLIYYLYNTECFFETLFVISDGISSNVQQKLKHTVRVPSFSSFPKSLQLIVRATYYFVNNVISAFKKKYTTVYGHDHLYYSHLYIKKAQDFVMIEDGLANYSNHHASNGGKMRKLLFGSSGPFFGWSEEVSHLILSGIVATPEEINHKVKIIDVVAKWNELTLQQKKSFINIFSSEPYMPLKKIVIFTQPFSEDAMMTELQKIEIYRKIYNHYLKAYDCNDICIKSHPRERTDYSVYFNCSFIRSEIPGQIMILNDKPEILVTIYSSVGYAQGNFKTHIWGTSFDSFLIKQVGYFEGNYDGWNENE